MGLIQREHTKGVREDEEEEDETPSSSDNIMGEHATTQKTKTSSSSAPPGQHKAPPHHRAPELQLDAKWEAAIDVSLRRVVYGAIGGTTMALLMCRGTTARAAVSAFGVGVGVGSAYGDASKIFQQH